MNQTDNNKAVATFFVVVFSVVEGDTSHRHNSWSRIYLVIFNLTTETCEGDEVDKGKRDWTPFAHQEQSTLTFWHDRHSVIEDSNLCGQCEI